MNEASFEASTAFSSPVTSSVVRDTEHDPVALDFTTDRSVACTFTIPSVFFFFPPTAESFGVSAQIGSGVVRGDPELRFYQGSTRGSTRVPPGFHQGFHQGSTRFHQDSTKGSTRVPPGSTRIPPGFHQGSTRVPPGFHQVLQGRGGLGWFEVRFHEGSTRVPPISSRAAGLRKVSQGFRQGSTRVPGCRVVRGGLR